MYLRALTSASLPKLKAFNAALLPVQYSSKLYRDLLDGPQELVRIALDGGGAVAGAVCCALEADQAAGDQQPDENARDEDGKDQSRVRPASLYILTLGVAPVHRGAGLGARLVQHVLAVARTAPCCRGVRRVYVHVQEGNEALAFYAKMGFSMRRRIENYYLPRVQPRHSMELELVIRQV